MNLPTWLVPERCVRDVRPIHIDSLVNVLTTTVARWTHSEPNRVSKQAAKVILQWNSYYTVRPGSQIYKKDAVQIRDNVRNLMRDGLGHCKS